MGPVAAPGFEPAWSLRDMHVALALPQQVNNAPQTAREASGTQEHEESARQTIGTATK
jgi:hypothetical protein